MKYKATYYWMSEAIKYAGCLYANQNVHQHTIYQGPTQRKQWKAGWGYTQSTQATFYRTTGFMGCGLEFDSRGKQMGLRTVQLCANEILQYRSPTISDKQEIQEEASIIVKVQLYGCHSCHQEKVDLTHLATVNHISISNDLANSQLVHGLFYRDCSSPYGASNSRTLLPYEMFGSCLGQQSFGIWHLASYTVYIFFTSIVSHIQCSGYTVHLWWLFISWTWDAITQIPSTDLVNTNPPVYIYLHLSII